MPGITWNSCCSPCPRGARRATHQDWAFIFHGQGQSTLCPCEIAGKPPQGQVHLPILFPRQGQKNPQQPQGPPHQREDFCGSHSPHHGSVSSGSQPTSASFIISLSRVLGSSTSCISCSSTCRRCFCGASGSPTCWVSYPVDYPVVLLNLTGR